MSCSAQLSPIEVEEYELQTGVMRPHSPAAIERGARLSKFVAATQDKIWVGELLLSKAMVEPSPRGVLNGHHEFRLKRGYRRYLRNSDRPDTNPE